MDFERLTIFHNLFEQLGCSKRLFNLFIFIYLFFSLMLPVVNGLGLEVQYVFPNDETKKRTLSRDGHDSMNYLRI